MTTLPTLITNTSAQERLEDDGLKSLGLTMPLLSGSWASAAVAFDENALTLTMASQVLAPVLAIRSWVDELRGHGVYQLDGSPITGTGAIVRLHPQAQMRLETLVQNRLPGTAGLIRPLPSTIVIRTALVDQSPRWIEPGDELAVDGIVTFHDERGLIVDPVAVAGLFNDLLTAFPALSDDTPSAAVGGLANVAALGSAGTFVHVVDPHGAAFAAVDSIEPRVMNGAADIAAVPASGLTELTAGQSIGILPAAAERLRVGWSRNATLGRTALTPPALPGGVTLNRQFLRVTAVDLAWHLLGNRSASTQHGVGPADQTFAAELRPEVRDRVRMDFSIDGVDSLATGGLVLAPPNAGAFSGLMFTTSPTLDANVGVPPAPGPAGHWPAFPAAGGAPGAAPTTNLASSMSAVWSGDQDVDLTFAAGALPVEWHVRVYPQQFQLITSISADQPSFLRGDGGARLVTDGNDLTISLINPLGLPDGAVQPADSVLTVDLVLTDRTNSSTIQAAITVPVDSGSAAATVDDFAAPDPLAIVPANVQGVAPAPLFGIPDAIIPPGSAGTVVELLRAFADETTPRIGPRLPSMARFPTLVAVADDTGGGDRTWDALVTGGRWSRETRCASPATANPGGPAGPDIHAPGVRVDGAAAYDVAQIALRRAQPLIPIGGLADSWIPFVGTPGWDAPDEPGNDTAPAGQTASRTSAVAVLRTVPVGVESPELSVDAVPMPDANASVQNLVDDLAALLGVPSPPVNIAREAEMVREVRREMHWSKFGSRDAQWALRRAIRQARDLVFVASPQFARTAYPDGAPEAHEVDLVDELVTRMTDHPSLLVVVCTPRWPDFDPEHGGWVRHAFTARNSALAALQEVDESRVVAFHPRGFPGRSAAIRTTSVIVDDSWMLSGTSHFRRRGMTFDEGVDVVGFDRALDTGGTSTRIRAFRRQYMAALAGINAADPEFVRLFGTRTCADVIGDLVSQGGLGQLAPFWSGPSDLDVAAQSDALADPDGGTSDDYLALFVGLLLGGL